MDIHINTLTKYTTFLSMYVHAQVGQFPLKQCTLMKPMGFGCIKKRCLRHVQVP